MKWLLVVVLALSVSIFGCGNPDFVCPSCEKSVAADAPSCGHCGLDFDEVRGPAPRHPDPEIEKQLEALRNFDFDKFSDESVAPPMDPEFEKELEEVMRNAKLGNYFFVCPSCEKEVDEEDVPFSCPHCGIEFKEGVTPVVKPGTPEK